MKKKILRGVSCLLVASILCQGAVTVDAGAKAGLADKKMSVYVKKSKKIVIKNKKKKAKYTFRSSDKKVAKVSAKGVVKALKVGTAKITVKESYKGKTRKVGTVKISCVAKAAKVSEAPANTPVVTPTPTVTPVQTTEPIQTATPTLTPVPTPVPTPTVTPEPPVELREITADMPKGFDQKQDGVSYGSVVKKKYFSTTTNKNRNVNIILPADYTTEKEYPVLYLFHGIGGDEDEWLQGKPQYIVGNLIAQGLAKEMIIVIPNCRARENDKAVTEFSLDHYAAFDNFINDLRDNLMPYMEANYSIATGRKNTAIAGLSMGGRESLNIGLHMPETFGYIAAFSPGMGVFEYTANGVHEEGLFTEDTFLLPEEYKFNTLLMLNNGISEGGENAIGGQCHRALEKNDIPHIFYVTEGGHDFKVWKHGLYNFALQIFQ